MARCLEGMPPSGPRAQWTGVQDHVHLRIAEGRNWKGRWMTITTMITTTTIITIILYYYYTTTSATFIYTVYSPLLLSRRCLWSL